MSRKIYPKRPYKTYGYYVTPHSIQRMNQRRISKGELGENLRKKPRYKSKVSYDTLKRPAYERYSFNKVLSIINPFRKVVASVRRYHEKDLLKKIKKDKKTKWKAKKEQRQVIS